MFLKIRIKLDQSKNMNLNRQKIVITGVGEISPTPKTTRTINAPFRNYTLRSQLWQAEKLLKDRPKVIEFDLKTEKGQNNYIANTTTAFDRMLESADMQGRIKRKEGERIGMIYLDFYKGTAIFKKTERVKDAYYLDIFPKFLKKQLPFEGLSFKLLADRNAAVEALLLASELIASDELSKVIIGGLFAVFDSFAITELLKTEKWDNLQCKQISDSVLCSNFFPFCERSVFVMVEAANEPQCHTVPHLVIDKIERTDSFATALSIDADYPGPSYGYLSYSNSRKITRELVEMVTKKLPNCTAVRIEEAYHDSFGLNVLNCFYDLLTKRIENSQDITRFFIVNWDRLNDFAAIYGRIRL